MDFLIADTFTDSLTSLTGDEQKAVKTTAFDLQMVPANPGMQFHRLSKAKDSNFWSVRVNADIRLIVHRSEPSLLLCYFGHHDGAHAWTERRKIERHPTTGAAQLVEIRETVKESVVPRSTSRGSRKMFLRRCSSPASRRKRSRSAVSPPPSVKPGPSRTCRCLTPPSSDARGLTPQNSREPAARPCTFTSPALASRRF